MSILSTQPSSLPSPLDILTIQPNLQIFRSYGKIFTSLINILIQLLQLLSQSGCEQDKKLIFAEKLFCSSTDLVASYCSLYLLVLRLKFYLNLIQKSEDTSPRLNLLNKFRFHMSVSTQAPKSFLFLILFSCLILVGIQSHII